MHENLSLSINRSHTDGIKKSPRLKTEIETNGFVAADLSSELPADFINEVLAQYDIEDLSILLNGIQQQFGQPILSSWIQHAEDGLMTVEEVRTKLDSHLLKAKQIVKIFEAIYVGLETALVQAWDYVTKNYGVMTQNPSSFAEMDHFFSNEIAPTPEDSFHRFIGNGLNMYRHYIRLKNEIVVAEKWIGENTTA